MSPFVQLPESERLRRIGELLVVAASRYWRDETLAGRVKAKRSPASPLFEVSDLVTSETDKRILRYLEQKVSASPVQISAALAIARSTLVRRIARLRAGGLIVVAGRTKGARYELAGQQQRN